MNFCFLTDHRFPSPTTSNEQASALDIGREIKKIKEVISYLTNFISYLPVKGKTRSICQILGV